MKILKALFFIAALVQVSCTPHHRSFDRDAEDDPLSKPLAAEFESIRANILVTKCQTCHSPGKSVARIPLVTKEDLLNSPLELVIPGNIEESGLVIAITRVDSKMMPPSKDAVGNPTGFTRLTDPEINAIQTWVAEGAAK